MKFIDRQFWGIVLVSLALAIPGARLFGQSQKSTKVSLPESGNRISGASLDCAELLRELDPDKDGFITQEEWIRVFNDHDKNGDKRLSNEEIRSISQQADSEGTQGPDDGRIAAFERLDTNRNDAIDFAEWPGKERDFRYMDANHNGSLSREEFLSRNGRWWNETFENLDFDGNGIIVRSEWLDSNASFDRLDRDRNGVIERHEFYDPR
jgi:Ca2+-binding EF-hand superfamily protein